MNTSLFLLAAASGLYLVSFAFYLAFFLGSRDEPSKFAFGFLRAGFLLSTFFFLHEAARQNHFLPVYAVSQALAFFAWSLGFVYLVLFVKIQRESFGLVLTPILVLLTAGAFFSFELEAPYDAGSVVLSNAYFMLHVAGAFFAYACFSVSFSAGILYLIQHHMLKARQTGRFYHKLPSLESLEVLVYQPMIWGTLLLLAATGVGVFWSKTSFGVYGFEDPKLIVTCASILVYCAILYMHYVSLLRGKRVTVFSLLAFGMVLAGFIGMRFVEGSHNFIRA